MARRGQQSVLTIVSLRSPEPSVPSSTIHPLLVEAVETVCRDKGRLKSLARHLSLLRCYFDVTGGRVRLWQKTAARDKGVALGFLGALESPSFYEAAPLTRYVHCSIWLSAIEQLGLITPTEFDALRPTAGPRGGAPSEHVETYAAMSLNPEMVDLWRGWKLENGTGRTYWPDMSKVYVKFGAAWTNDFHQAIAVWFRARKQTSIPVLTRFLEFLVETESVTAERLRIPAFTTKMWEQFWIAYQRGWGGKSSRFCFLVNWKTWREFVSGAITSPRLIARSLIELPGPASVPRPYFGETESGAPMNLGLIRIDGLPGLSDTEAMDHFLREVPCALSAVNQWADCEVQGVFEAHMTSSRAGRNAQPRIVGASGVNTGQQWLYDSANPDALANAAATLRTGGYTTDRDADLSNLFPKPLKDIARLLGLPLREAMLPFAAVLVAEHPAITASFLEKLELFDKNGKPHAFRRIDGGWYLLGVKDRKGRATAEQRFKLSPRAASAVAKLISITRSPRQYLRSRGDDHWRRLFISTGASFGYPRPVRFNSIACEVKRAGGIGVKSLSAEAKSLPTGNLSQFFTLKELRKTAGLQVLIDTHSERAAAEALGHEDWRPALIRRYLPEGILRLFRARWIRMFQNLVLIHTSPSADYALKVTGLADAEALEKYLEQSAFPHLKQMLNPPSQKNSSAEDFPSGEFIFEANPQTVAALRTLAKAKSDVVHSPFWHSFAQHMMRILEDRATMDPQIALLLKAGGQA